MITTKFLGPTNHRGSRVKATGPLGSITISWDHALNISANHDAAARAYATKFDAHGEALRDCPDGGGFVYVYATREPVQL